MHCYGVIFKEYAKVSHASEGRYMQVLDPRLSHFIIEVILLYWAAIENILNSNSQQYRWILFSEIIGCRRFVIYILPKDSYLKSTIPREWEYGGWEV